MLSNTVPVHTQGDLEGQKIGLTFDENSLAHIMSVLTDLYSDPELAVIREYSTNAFDAHVEAGVDKPIQVTTPTGIFPFFVIQDFGVGLSVYDIENIYSKYGASTKRNTNAQTGMLGLGCKSALTYTGQFNIVGVKDGEKAHVSISRSNEGGTMEIVDVSPTSEPNGVKVTIPVKNAYSIIEKTKEFFKYWSPGTVLLDGKDPSFKDSLTSIYDNGKYDIKLNPGGRDDKIVMGNVAYPTEHRLVPHYNRLPSIIAYVPMGSVNFTPSREQLHYTKLTEATVSDVKHLIKQHLVKSAIKEIQKADTPKAAITLRDDWDNRLGSQSDLKDVKFHGREIPRSFQVRMTYNPRRYRYKVDLYNRPIDLGRMGNSNSVFLMEYDNVNINKTQRDKIDEYCSTHGITVGTVYVLSDEVDTYWFDGFQTISWKKISEEVKLKRKQSGKPRGPVYTVFDFKSDSWEDVTTIKDPIVYMNQPEQRQTSKWFIDQLKGNTIVSLPKNRWKKFLKDFPNAVHVSEKAKEIVSNYEKSISDLEKQLIMGGSNDAAIASTLSGHAHKFLDIALRNKISSYKQLHEGAIKKYQKMASLSALANYSMASLNSYSGRMFDEYPMIYYVSTWDMNRKPDIMNHCVTYINAVYKEKNK